MPSHIVFGLASPVDYTTVTKDDYKKKQLPRIERVQGPRRVMELGDTKIRDIFTTTQTDFVKKAIEPIHLIKPGAGITTFKDKFHKPETQLQNAHVGLETRKDLPIDKHFKLNTSTTQDTFKPHRVDVPSRPGGKSSSIVLGDTHYKTYETEASAFKPYHVEKKGNRFSHPPFRNGIIFDDQHKFESTHQADFQKVKPCAASLIFRNGQKSSIRIGDEKVPYPPSVTRGDFLQKELQTHRLVKPNGNSNVRNVLQPAARPTDVSISSTEYVPQPMDFSINKLESQASNLVFGDHRLYLGCYSTSNTDDFRAKELPLKYHHQVAKNQIILGDSPLTYETSSFQREFSQQEREACIGKSIVPPTNLHTEQGEFSGTSTFSDHFKGQTGQKSQLLKALPAQRKNLFPTFEKNYTTTNQIYYSPRQGLDNKVEFKKGNMTSSIVFGHK